MEFGSTVAILLASAAIATAQSQPSKTGPANATAQLSAGSPPAKSAGLGIERHKN
jgi:hypothetical protein